MRDKSGIIFAIVCYMKYLVIVLPALALAIHWGEAGFPVLCIASLIILKMWEHEQDKKKSN